MCTLGWGYKTKNRVIVSAIAKFAAFGHTFAIKFVSHPSQKVFKPLGFFLKSWPHLEGKTAPNHRKYAIFKNWLDSRPKMETHEPNVYLTALGVFREVFGVCSQIWALEVPFIGT